MDGSAIGSKVKVAEDKFKNLIQSHWTENYLITDTKSYFKKNEKKR